MDKTTKLVREQKELMRKLNSEIIRLEKTGIKLKNE
jgi:hypothetical protein